MKIICPECQFTRDVPTDKLPANSVMATCPQCQHRFKVMREDVATYSDSSIPHGAHIPSQDEPLYTQAPDYTTQSNEKSIDSETKNQEQDEQIDEEERQKAAAAYAEQAAADSFAKANPWDYTDQHGYIAAFYQTVIWVMLAPARFFAGLIPQSSRIHILMFYIAVRIIQMSFEFFWGSTLSASLEPAAADDVQLQAVLNLLTPKTDFIFAILSGTALSTIEIFLGSLFYFCMFKFIAGNKANFSIVFQVVAYSSAPLLLAVIPIIGTIVGFIWSIGCMLIGCRYAMQLSWSQTILGIAPLYIFGILLLFMLLTGGTI